MPFLNATSSPVKVEPVDDAVQNDVKKVSSEDKSEDLDYTFATETSLHGVSYIVNAKNFLVKTIWTVIFFVFLGVLIWQIVLLLINFAKYTPVTEVSIEVTSV